MAAEGIGTRESNVSVFGSPGLLLLLGAMALENFGVQADPTTQKLRPMTAVIGTASAAKRGPYGLVDSLSEKFLSSE